MKELTMIENELVPVYKTSTGQKVVYGTELHKALDVKSRFNDWVRNRLNDCDAVENEEYETVTKKLVSGGKTKEYIIELDAAKEMAMLERNEKGKQVRRYFIQIEKKYKEKEKEDRKIVTVSNTKLPPANGWFKRVNPKMIDVIETNLLTRKRLYHIMLSRISNKFDWYSALAIFKKERGFDPVFPMDVVAYFPEMQEEAERILDRLAQPLFSTMEFPEDAPFNN